MIFQNELYIVGCLSIAAISLLSTLSPPQLPVEPSKKLSATLEETFARDMLLGFGGKEFIGRTEPDGGCNCCNLNFEFYFPYMLGLMLIFVCSYYLAPLLLQMKIVDYTLLQLYFLG